MVNCESSESVWNGLSITTFTISCIAVLYTVVKAIKWVRDRASVDRTQSYQAEINDAAIEKIVTAAIEVLGGGKQAMQQAVRRALGLEVA